MLNLNNFTKDYIIIYNYVKNELIINEQDFMGKINLFFCTLSINPWASFATWLCLEAPQENTKKINKYWLQKLN